MLVLACLSACVTKQNPPRPKLPADDVGKLLSVEGDEIYTREYFLNKNHSQTIYIVSGPTGINHHHETQLIKALLSTDSRVIVIHPFGAGYSEGKRGDSRDFSKIVRSQEGIIISYIQSSPPKHRHILFGHSMSAAVAMAIAAKVQPISGLILINPPYRLEKTPGMSPSARDIMRFAWHVVFARHRTIVDMAGNPKLIQNPDDRAEACTRQNDPLLVRYFSLYYMTQTRKLAKSMGPNATHSRVPLLMLCGDADDLVDDRGCQELVNQWGTSHKRYVSVKGGGHGQSTITRGLPEIQRWVSQISYETTPR